MPARQFTIVVDQGSDYALRIPVLDTNAQAVTVDSWTVKGQVRARYPAAVPQELDVAPDGTAVILRIPASYSTDWAFRSARYDVEITSPDGLTTTRLIEGPLIVKPEITRY